MGSIPISSTNGTPLVPKKSCLDSKNRTQTGMPEWLKGPDLRSGAFASWVRTPLPVLLAAPFTPTMSFLTPKTDSTRLAQSVERQTFNLVVEGSSPSSGALVLSVLLKNRLTRLAQLVERQTFNLVVEGSSPSSGARVCMFSLKTYSFGLIV
jgi:hypothetical protein